MGKFGTVFRRRLFRFLGSPEQVDIVERLMQKLGKKNSLFLVDPVLGDDGKLYPTQTEELVQRMRRLAGKADIITPNYTEVCFLLDTPYEETVTFKQAKEYLKALSALGDKKNKNKSVIITSAPCEEDSIRVFAYDAESKRFWQTKSPKIPAAYPGTGDTFASVFLGALLQKIPCPWLWRVPPASSMKPCLRPMGMALRILTE